eukprot:147470_1
MMSIVFTILIITTANIFANALSGTASFTTYTSYAACCKNNPNYDPTADTTECDDYSACDYSGQFSVLGNLSFTYVKLHNLIAFYDSSDPNGEKFDNTYGGKTIRLTKGDITFEAIIADTCGDFDCDGCCTKNAKPSGYLVDMEYWTVINNFGSIDNADGEINFVIETNAPSNSSNTNNGTTYPIWVYIVAGVVSVLILITIIGIIFILRKQCRKRNDPKSFVLLSNEQL